MQIRLNKPYALNEIGGGKRNEDSIYPEKGKATADDRCFLVCDGIGGHNRGDIASRTVCRAFAAILKETDLRNFNETIFKHSLDIAVEQLDGADTETGGRNMGTTLTFVCFHARGVFMAHIGDSRIYHLRKQGGQVGILYKSHDHSLVNDLIRAGIITPEEALTHPKKNVITRALISKQETQPKADVLETDDIREGDYFFLCTDGVLEQVNDELLCEIVARETDDKAKINAIYEACQGRSHDNFSAWLIPVAEVVQEPEIATTEYGTAVTDVPAIAEAPQPAPPAKKKRKRIGVYILLCGALLAGAYAGIQWMRGADESPKPLKKEQQTPVNGASNTQNRASGSETGTANSQKDATNSKPEAAESTTVTANSPTDTANSNTEAAEAKKNTTAPKNGASVSKTGTAVTETEAANSTKETANPNTEAAEAKKDAANSTKDTANSNTEAAKPKKGTANSTKDTANSNTEAAEAKKGTANSTKETTNSNTKAAETKTDTIDQKKGTAVSKKDTAKTPDN